jgi:hypothetical protein
MAFWVARSKIRSNIGPGVRVGSSESKYAASPATCAQACDVPEVIAATFGPPIQDDLMLTPGANKSRSKPKLLLGQKAFVISDAPTTTTASAEAGDEPEASTPPFPAAVTTVTLSTINILVASLTDCLRSPLKAKEAIEGLLVDLTLPATQLSPLIVCALVPKLVLSRTLTPIMLALLATP